MANHKMLSDDEVRDVTRRMRECGERWIAQFDHMEESAAKNQCESYGRSLITRADSLDQENEEIDDWISAYQKQIEAAKRELMKPEEIEQ